MSTAVDISVLGVTDITGDSFSYVSDMLASDAPLGGSIQWAMTSRRECVATVEFFCLVDGSCGWKHSGRQSKEGGILKYTACTQ